jgi:hypothetical protein
MTSDEPTHTILIGIGTHLIDMGHREQAEAFIRDARAEALRRGDTDSVEDADKLLEGAA